MVRLTPAAAKALGKLPAAVGDRIVAALDRFDKTGQGDVKRLAGARRGQARQRVGAYRAVFELDPETNDLVVVDVGHRRDIYDR